jgi:hypothetical protein
LYPGSVHDYHIYKLEMTSEWATVRLQGRVRQCKILADLGYQSPDPQLIMPAKTSRNHPELTVDELARNLEIGSSRIVVEQFNGRLKEKFRIFFHQYFGDHAAYEQFLTAGVWLTNIDLQLHQLKADDPRDALPETEDEEEDMAE